ncbi:MAG: Helix-turn-helix domain, partial [Pedosphaera sp.]|nr:Helix-turn-helix domain [Pedosphaera sp.]
MNDRERAICARVKQFREQIKWPQPALASELGLTKDKLASIEYGRTPLRYNTAIQLCHVFDLNPHWLATGTGNMRPTNALQMFPTLETVAKDRLFTEVLDAELTEAGPKRTVKDSKTATVADRDYVAELMKAVIESSDAGNFASPEDRMLFAKEA